jgi:hypothetical protein
MKVKIMSAFFTLDDYTNIYSICIIITRSRCLCIFERLQLYRYGTLRTRSVVRPNHLRHTGANYSDICYEKGLMRFHLGTVFRKRLRLASHSHYCMLGGTNTRSPIGQFLQKYTTTSTTIVQ